jgi:predicted small lipoprotein YifL
MPGKKMSARTCLSLIAACALLTACGQRGALYLPDEGRNVVVTPAQSPASNAPAASPAAATPEATPEQTEEQRRNSTAPAK